MNKQNLHKIIQDLIEVRGESGLKVTDDKLFEQACSFARGESMDKNNRLKDTLTIPRGKTPIGISEIKSDASVGYSKNFNSPATQNQIEYLKKQGVKVNQGLTKQEAFIMIRNYKESLKRGNI
jgi:hypothetical protein